MPSKQVGCSHGVALKCFLFILADGLFGGGLGQNATLPCNFRAGESCRSVLSPTVDEASGLGPGSGLELPTARSLVRNESVSKVTNGSQCACRAAFPAAFDFRPPCAVEAAAARVRIGLDFIQLLDTFKLFQSSVGGLHPRTCQATVRCQSLLSNAVELAGMVTSLVGTIENCVLSLRTAVSCSCWNESHAYAPARTKAFLMEVAVFKTLLTKFLQKPRRGQNTFSEMLTFFQVTLLEESLRNLTEELHLLRLTSEKALRASSGLRDEHAQETACVNALNVSQLSLLSFERRFDGLREIFTQNLNVHLLANLVEAGASVVPTVKGAIEIYTGMSTATNPSSAWKFVSIFASAACLAAGACNRSSQSGECSTDDACRLATTTVNHSAAFLLAPRLERLQAAARLICASHDNATSSRCRRSNLPKANSCGTYCLPRLSCPRPVYVYSRSPDKLAMKLSFDPLAASTNRITALLGSVGWLDRDRTELQPTWCRLSCEPEAFGASSFIVEVLRRLVQVMLAVYLAVLLFAAFVIRKNSVRMLENPRRTFLYVNIVSLYSRLRVVTIFLPATYSYCNQDGSLVLNREGVTGLCVANALLKEVTMLALPMSMAWVCYEWHKTICHLVAMEQVPPANTSRERLFMLAFILLPWTAALGQLLFTSQIFEGHQILKTCTFALMFNFQSSKETQVIVTFATLVFGAVFTHRSSKLFRKYSYVGHLRRWSRRHRVISLLCWVYALHVLVHVAGVVFSVDFQNGLRNYNAIRYKDFRQCLLESLCKYGTSLEGGCSAPQRTLYLQLLYYFEAGLLESIGSIASFSWLGFKEINWPVLLRVKFYLDNHF